MCQGAGDEEKLAWAQESASQGDRSGIFMLGEYYHRSARDEARALELYWQAAALDHPAAQVQVGSLAFGANDWERWYWWGRGAANRCGARDFWGAVSRMLPEFEDGQSGRIMHTVAPFIKAQLDVRQGEVYGRYAPVTDLWMLDRVVMLQEKALRHAKRAIACWSIVSRRCGVAKDMRVMVAKMAWEPWRWVPWPKVKAAAAGSAQAAGESA
jgi:hypothetical protein